MNSRIALPIALLVAASACSKSARPAAPSVPVTVAKAEERPVPYDVTAPGTVEAIQSVAVSPQVSGIVTSVNFHEGDEVKAGQILFRIEARPYRAALEQADGTLARDIVQLINAQKQVDRYKSLAKSEYVTDEQYQSLVATADGMVATVKSDSAAVDAARLNLEWCTIRAPISGRTGSLLVKEGNLVRAPGTGSMVMINETKPIQVRFAVPASYLPDIRQRQNENLKVNVALNDGRPPITGRLSFVDNAVDTTTGTIMLKGHFDNSDGGLWPGQFVTATLVLYIQNSVVVPAPAVMNGEKGPYVFVIKNDKADTRPVDVGRTVEDVVIVNKGVTPGETVVTDGQLRLTPNAKVEIKGAGEEDGKTPVAGGGDAAGRGKSGKKDKGKKA